MNMQTRSRCVIQWRGIILFVVSNACVLLTGCNAVLAGAPPRPDRDATKRTVRRSETAPIPKNADLQWYLSEAERSNPGLEASRNSWFAAYRKLDQATALPDPRVTLGYFLENVETRVGPQEWSLGIMQTFPWYGKLDLRGRIAQQEAHAAFYKYQAVRAALAYSVQDAWYEYWYLAKAIETLKRTRQIIEHVERVATTEYKANRTPYAVVIKAQVELGKLQDRIEAHEDMRGPLSARLMAAIGRPGGEILPFPSTERELTVDIDEEKVIEWIQEGNPELAEMAHKVMARSAAADLAHKDRYPDVTLGLNYINTDEALMRNAPDSGKDPVLATVSVNLPIWMRKLAAAEQEARELRMAAAQARTERANMLDAEARMVLYALRDADRRVDLYRDTLLPKARQSFEAQEAAFVAGETTFQQLLDAERLLLEFELAWQRARADRALAIARLEMMAGRPILTQNGSRADSAGSGGPETIEETEQ